MRKKKEKAAHQTPPEREREREREERGGSTRRGWSEKKQCDLKCLFLRVRSPQIGVRGKAKAFRNSN